MQLGPLELVILLAIILLLFGGGRIVKIMREVGEGPRKLRDGLGDNQTRKDSSPGNGAANAPGGDSVPRDQNKVAIKGGMSGGVAVAGNDNVITYINDNPQIARCYQKLFPVFVSYTDEQIGEREAVRVAATWLGLAGPELSHLVDDTPPSSSRSKDQVDEGLSRCHTFLMFASTLLAQSQQEEYSHAKEIETIKGYFYLTKPEYRAVFSDALKIPQEAVATYVTPGEVPGLIIGLMADWMADSALHRDNPWEYSHSDLMLLLGLGDIMGTERSWISELRTWLEAQYPQEPMRDALPKPAIDKPATRPAASKKRPPAPPAGYIPETVPVPAGYFWMGSQDSDTDAYKEEKPYHEVYLDAYRIGKYPVTVAQFRIFVDQTGHQTDREKYGDEYTWRTPRGKGSDLHGKDQHPVTQISWNDAKAYCDWLNRITNQHWDLPTEAQWERAARDVDGRKYPWRNAAPDKSRCNISGWFEGTTPVGQFSPLGDSLCGCADMSGNVWEWCADWYDGKYYQTLPKRARNPRGPERGEYHVVRGGSWGSSERLARCAYRYWSYPCNFHDRFGFRVVVVALPSSL